MPAEIYKNGHVVQWLIEGDRVLETEFGYPLSIMGTSEGISIKVGGIFRDLKPVYLDGRDNPRPIRLDSGYEIHVIFDSTQKHKSRRMKITQRPNDSFDTRPQGGAGWI